MGQVARVRRLRDGVGFPGLKSDRKKKIVGVTPSPRRAGGRLGRASAAASGPQAPTHEGLPGERPRCLILRGRETAGTLSIVRGD